MATIYIDIGIESVLIENTRSKHEDTDYIVFASKIGTAAPEIQFKSLGNHNSGSFPVNLRALAQPVNTGDQVLFTYVIINSSTSVARIQPLMQDVGFAWITQDRGTPAPANFTSAMQYALTYFSIPFKSIFDPTNCDGMVAAELDSFTSDQITEMTANSTFTYTTHNPGVHSNSGCGPNSQYDVTWSIGRNSKLQ